VVDIEKENRLSKIISLYSKGHTESEIAERVGVDQSIVSRDL
jgi:DNA-binding MarR family transcriptional regulator